MRRPKTTPSPPPDVHIEALIDQQLTERQLAGWLKRPDPTMPPAMRDPAGEPDADWLPWQPIPSTVTSDDLLDLEAIVGAPLPQSYRRLLGHVHFYELFFPNDLQLFPHLPGEWKRLTIEHYTRSWQQRPYELLQQGLVYFANWNDWGLLCFDTTRRRQHHEYPIVLLDHEDLNRRADLAPNLPTLLIVADADARFPDEHP